MKARQRTPLWLICDVSAWLRLHLALGVLAMAVRRFLPKNSSKPPSREGIVWLCAWQAGCEALLRWVIARQAFRLCGLDPKLARSRPMSEARNSFAWCARNRAFIRMYETMTACARRLAGRIREAMAGKPSAPAHGQPAPAHIAPALVIPFQPSWTRGIPAPP